MYTRKSSLGLFPSWSHSSLIILPIQSG
uniref:Uncharacterized protein n=1 Tax=Arundo donax TaxID=35708 RepID=A0A0A8ZTP8_ARUDO